MTDKEGKADVPQPNETLFKTVKYYSIGNIDEKIEKLLNERGAKKDSYLSQMVTHVIADDDSNDEYSEAKELFELPVVTSHWVELSAKCNKMLPLSAFNPETKQIFSGVVCCPSQLQKEDSTVLWAMITFHGGRCQLDLNQNVTHLLTTRPQGAKYDCAITHESITIVTPDWIIDCINEKTRVEETKYHPKLLILTPPKEPTPPPPPSPVPSPPKVQPPVKLSKTPKLVQQMQMEPPKYMTPPQGMGHPRPPYPSPAMQRFMTTPPQRMPMNQPQFAQMDQSMPRTMGMPPRPDNIAAREAIARMVNNRIQHTGNRVSESPDGHVNMNMLQRHPIPMPHQMMAGSPDAVSMQHRFPHHMSPNMSGPNAPQRGMVPMSPRHPQFNPANMPQHLPGHMPPGSYPAGSMHPRPMGHMSMNIPGGNPPPRGALGPVGSAPPSGKMSPRGAGMSSSPVRGNTPTGTPKSSKNNSRSTTPNRTLRNITNGAEEAFPPNKQSNKIQQIMSSITRSPRSNTRPNQYQNRLAEDPRYYGHDEIDRVPGELCLLGCIFYITDYPKSLARDELETWQMVIEQHGGIVDPSYSNRVTHILCEHQKSDVYQMAIRDNKRVVTAFWLNDVLLQKKMLPPWQALHFPSLYTDFKPGKDQIISVSGYEQEERTKVKQMIHMIGAKYTGYMTRANTVLLCKKPEGVKFEKAKEWRIPVVNTCWLSDIVTGALVALKLNIPMKYQMFPLGEDEFKVDPSQVQPWLHGWRVPVKVPKESWKKFTPSSGKNSSSDVESNKRKSPTENELPSPEPKKARLLSEPEVNLLKTSEVASPKVLFTGLSKNQTEKYSENIKRLGGSLATCSSECTHLVTNAVSRTVKFLTCVSCCRFIVSSDWVEDSASQSRFLDEDMYIIKDTKGETEFNCCIRESLKRSASKKLFEGFTFYLTPGVQPSRSVVKEVIENAGGRLVKSKPSARTVSNGRNDKGEQTYIIISTENDLHLCKEYFAKHISVFNAEFVLSGVLQQQVDYHSYRMETL